MGFECLTVDQQSSTVRLFILEDTCGDSTEGPKRWDGLVFGFGSFKRAFAEVTTFLVSFY